MPTVFKASGAATAPAAVECVEPGYPNRDADGAIMYHNSHLAAEADAWEWLLRDTEAHISQTAGRITEARRRLRELEQEAADAVVRRKAVADGWEKFKEKSCSPEPTAAASPATTAPSAESCAEPENGRT